MQLDELKAALKELTDEIAALRLSISNEIARVEDVIAKLKASSIDPAELEPITAQLLATVDTLKGGQAALDGEQVAPAAPVDPAPPAQAAGA